MTLAPLLILAALCGQPDSIPNPLRSVPIQAMDWGFMEAQEAFVMDTLPRGDRATLAQVVPVGVGHLFTAMGVSCYHCRDIAKADLARRCADDPRWFFWGMRWGDPEIRFRCENLVRAASRCAMCGGTGGNSSDSWDLTCRICHGYGRHWPLERFLD